MAASVKSNGRRSLAMERTGQWVFSQEIPTDVVVEVGEAIFSLHKFMLVAKSGYIRNLIMESDQPDLTRIELPGVPGGPEIFEKAAKFCYSVNFEITVHNVAALRCAAEYLRMTEKYCEGNLANRTEEFLACVGLTSLANTVAVLKSCESLLPMAEELKIVQRCIDTASIKACNEANFPTRSPPEWWTKELSILDIAFFRKVLTSMKSRNTKTQTIVSALITYSEQSLRELVRDHSGNGTATSYADPGDANLRKHQKNILESIISLLPSDKASFPINFLCCLLRAAIFLNTSVNCKNELEKRISAILEHVTVADLLVFSFTYDGERLFDLDSVRRIIFGFVEKERNAGVFNGGDYGEKGCWTVAMQKVAKTTDAYLAEIATDRDLSISKFTGIAVIVPKGARKVDDDIYRAIDIYLKAHPGLDEIEREKVCSVMDPLKLSYEARVHASQNKRLPVQIVLHALYYDQLKLRSGVEDKPRTPDATTTRKQIQADTALIRENEALRMELMKMKMYVTDIQKNNGGQSKLSKRPTFFSSVSKTLGKLNPFRHGSKDTSNIDDGADGVDVTKPRRRRFSIS
ncbi:root phototropism protein 2 isoform X2 [Magnolia sinica]|uniref:root phototropism protein 2 isoform X2 n=1 Tax=Magnolia sinica TaxID=86752 RepID=UPI00265A0083|nr:root phototropism protein 2 isoform X2 [Magnolia sinica]